MAMDDLFKAMEMFKSGVQDFALSRAINSANEQVQGIRAAEMDEMQKRQMLSQVSNDLVTRMAALGAPATTMAAAAGAMAPPKFANAADMHMQGMQMGDQSLVDAAAQQQEFENNPKFELAKIREQAKFNPLAQMKFEEQQDQFKTKQFSTFSNKLNPELAVRSAYGRAAAAVQRANALETLIGKASYDISAANKLPPQMVQELAMGLASMVKGGVATQHEAEEFAPSTLGMDKAKLQQYMTNGVEGAQAGEFVQMYAKTIKRERAEMQREIDDTALKIAQGNLSLYKQDPELFKETVARQLGISSDEVVIDDKKKTVTTVHRQMEEKRVKAATVGLRAAYAAMKSQDPEEVAKAQRVFQTLRIDPSKQTLQEAIQNTRFQITRGLLE